jgi:hypothetical protein
MTQLKRLLDEPGSDLDRVLLEAGMDEAPPKASLDRTLVALGVGSATAVGAGIIGACGAGASLGGAKGLFGLGVAKWVGGALLASAAIGGGFLITQQAAPESPPPAVVAPATPDLVARADAPAAARGPAAELAPSAVPQPDANTPKSQAVAPEAKLDAAAKPDTAKPDSAKSDSAKSDQKATQSKPSEKTQPAAGAETPKPDLTAGGGALSDELRTLDVARKASLAGDHDACLATLANYGKKFPKGQLASDAQAMKASCAAKKAATAP